MMLRSRFKVCLMLVLFSTLVAGDMQRLKKIMDFFGIKGFDYKPGKAIHEWAGWDRWGWATFYQGEKCTIERGVYTHPRRDKCDNSCQSLNGAISALLIHKKTALRVFASGDCSGDEIEFTHRPKDRTGVCVTWAEAAYSFQIAKMHGCGWKWEVTEMGVGPWHKFWDRVKDDSGHLDDDDGGNNETQREVDVEANSEQTAKALKQNTKHMGDVLDKDAAWRSIHD